MERQNRSRSAHLASAYSRLRRWPAAHSRACIWFAPPAASKILTIFSGVTTRLRARLLRGRRMDTNWEQRRQPRITRMTRIKRATDFHRLDRKTTASSTDDDHRLLIISASAIRDIPARSATALQAGVRSVVLPSLFVSIRG